MFVTSASGKPEDSNDRAVNKEATISKEQEYSKTYGKGAMEQNREEESRWSLVKRMFKSEKVCSFLSLCWKYLQIKCSYSSVPISTNPLIIFLKLWVETIPSTRMCAYVYMWII